MQTGFKGNYSLDSRTPINTLKTGEIAGKTGNSIGAMWHYTAKNRLDFDTKGTPEVDKAFESLCKDSGVKMDKSA